MRIQNPKQMISRKQSHEGIDWLFVRIPKTGSTSVCRTTNRPFHHRTALEWRQSLGVREFNSRFKFAFVRDPYDRFLSMFYFFGVFSRMRDADPNDFLAKVDWEEFSKRPDADLVRPQSEYLFDDKGKSLVDVVARFEDIDAEWAQIAARIGAEATLGHYRQCRKEKADLTPESKAKIYERYEADFTLLGYKK